MTATLLAWGPNQLAVAVILAYAAAGFAVGTALTRRGQPSATAVSAIAVWPLLLPLLQAAPAAPTRAGPMRARIDEVFGALSQVLTETHTTELSGPDLDALRTALYRADERLAVVDGLLANPLDAEVGRLREARAHASSEIEAVLSGLLELRLQVGLLTLSGRGASVVEQLQSLRSRVAALEEVAAVR
jgi:hypothetical protein